ncbi:MAG: DNA polymerase III subunit epsilon [Pseudomonadales bacterium]|nr:DNA polymerase III subunit epsilon [Pseudomonadales bacterium]
MRQIVLDTETTGLEPDMGHRVIEIGAVELINRKFTGRHFHEYMNPDRAIDDGALEVHGITASFLADKPRFGDIAESFLSFVSDADLVIHNAPFDLSFLDYELKRWTSRHPKLSSFCTITDSLVLARQKHPGQKNNLDALCRRYFVDNSQRELHGALLDAEILADVYLLMTGGQTNLFGSADDEAEKAEEAFALTAQPNAFQDLNLVTVSADESEQRAHEAYLDFLAEKNGSQPVWRTSSTAATPQ